MKAWLVAAFALVVLASNGAHAIPTRWQRGFDAAHEQLEKNLRSPSHRNPHFHAFPAPKYPGVYLWDSAFISLIWNEKNPAIAKEIIRSVLHNQKSDGRVPHAVDFFGASSLTQPPLLAWAANRIVAKTGDVAFAREIFPKLKRYNEWLFAQRRLHTGLFFWKHAYESGIDNSPRFGSRDESYYVDTTKLESVDMSSFVVMDSESLASLARTIANAAVTNEVHDAFAADELRFAARARVVAQLVRERLWDERTGYFFDRRTTDGSFVAIPTIASFFPLAAGIPTEAQASRLVAHARNPAEFNTPIPFPTVSRSAPEFEKDMWRGPVWINTAYLALQGLKRYGRTDLAKEMGARLVDGVYSTWHYTGKFVEFYDPEAYHLKDLSRKKGLGLWGLSSAKSLGKVLAHLFLKQFFLGTKPVDHFIGWTGLVNVLAVEDQLTPPPNAPPLR